MVLQAHSSWQSIGQQQFYLEIKIEVLWIVHQQQIIGQPHHRTQLNPRQSSRNAKQTTCSVVYGKGCLLCSCWTRRTEKTPSGQRSDGRSTTDLATVSLTELAWLRPRLSTDPIGIDAGRCAAPLSLGGWATKSDSFLPWSILGRRPDTATFLASTVSSRSVYLV
ncbi:hypothetical protein BaRGS_00002002 [Batillaria attramentaria]|uniref:Uncharacterized protein n=1 Tax=Batillaria attramentaria TaxID=370345 RepID=A0ABD0M4S5_9CAEN